MGKRLVLLLLILSLTVCLLQSPAFANSLAERRTVVPEGVREIDLRTQLGDDARGIQEVWMLNTGICVLLRKTGNPDENTPSWWDENDYELIVLDTRDVSILSRVLIEREEDTYQRMSNSTREDGGLILWFTFWRKGTEGTKAVVSACTQISVAPDGTVVMDTNAYASSRLTLMPGGKTAIRDGDDGSLYAVDLSTGQEELLIQGYSKDNFREDENAEGMANYIPAHDELRESYYPYALTDIDMFVRDFYVYTPLDEYRFVYAIICWEWEAGYGVYDLRTRTDHRITGLGHFFGEAGGMLFGQTLKADAHTYETTVLPALVQEQFEAASVPIWGTDAPVSCAISPDGKLLALTGMIARSIEQKKWWDTKGIEPKFDYAHTVTITDMETGALVKAFDIANPFATERYVSFYDDTHVMLFCEPAKQGSAFIYLLDIEGK